MYLIANLRGAGEGDAGQRCFGVSKQGQHDEAAGESRGCDLGAAAFAAEDEGLGAGHDDGAGAFEVAVVLALGGMGVPAELALAFGIGYHAVHLVPVGIIGGGYLLHAGYRGGVVKEEA